MAKPVPDDVPESILLTGFAGIKNTVSEERLEPTDLSMALNVDLDDAGQLRRRRGMTLKDAASYHSVKGPIEGKVYGVRAGLLGIIREDFSFSSLGVSVGTAPVCYAAVNEEVYFSGLVQGVITADETIQSWGATNGQGEWDSPVVAPTDTLGEVAGELLGDPPRASVLEYYNGRIYLAAGKVLWATELFRYHYVNRTAGYMQFEHDIVMLLAMSDGLYVGTLGGLHFLKGRTLKEFQLITVTDSPVLPGSDVWVPVDMVHPQAANAPVPTGEAAVFMTQAGVCAGFDGGTVYNLTQARAQLPQAMSAAALFRQQDGVNQYLAVTDSGGTPTANVRFGDFVEAELVRFQGG